MTRSDMVCFGLLAGGLSRRMGTDKASLVWRGRPLWRHQLRLAGEIGAREVLISGKPAGPYRGAALVVPDESSHCGPLAGIVALLGAMESEWLVAVAVDMPLLEGETLRRVLDARSGEKGVVPVLNCGAEPLAAVYPRAVLALARKQIESADHSLQGFVRAAAKADLIQLLPWPVERADCFRSVNTPGEFVAAQQRATD